MENAEMIREGQGDEPVAKKKSELQVSHVHPPNYDTFKKCLWGYIA